MGFIFAHVVAINPTVICSHTGTSINLYVCIDNTQSDRGSTVPFSLLFLTGESLSRAKNLSYTVALLFLLPFSGISISRHNFYVNASIPTTGAIHHSNHKICDSNRIRKLFAICDFNRIHEPSEF